MTGKVKISFLVLVWGIVAIQIYVNYTEQERRTAMVTAFSVAEEAKTQKVIEGYGYFGQMALSDGNKKEMLKSLLEKLGFQGDFAWSQKEDGEVERTILQHKQEGVEVTLQFLSVKEKEEEPKQYIAIRMEHDKDMNQVVAFYEKVKQVYREIEVEATVNLEVELEKNGNLIEAGANEMTEDFFAILQAKEVDRIMTNGIYTVYGYTKQEEDYLLLKGEKVNVSIAMYYDETTQKTYIKLGLPMINSSY